MIAKSKDDKFVCCKDCVPESFFLFLKVRDQNFFLFFKSVIVTEYFISFYKRVKKERLFSTNEFSTNYGRKFCKIIENLKKQKKN